MILSPQTATLQPQGIARNAQAQAKAAIAGARTIKTGKGRKNPLQLFRRHPAALIIKPKMPHVALAPPIKTDDTLGRRVTNGITQDVLQGLSQAIEMPAHPAMLIHQARQA